MRSTARPNASISFCRFCTRFIPGETDPGTHHDARGPEEAGVVDAPGQAVERRAIRSSQGRVKLVGWANTEVSVTPLYAEAHRPRLSRSSRRCAFQQHQLQPTPTTRARCA